MSHRDLMELVARLRQYIADKEDYMYRLNFFADCPDRVRAVEEIDAALPLSGMLIPVEDLEACLRGISALLKLEGMSMSDTYQLPKWMYASVTCVGSVEAM